MKLTRLTIESLLGIHRLDLRIDAPVLFLAGPNAAGKSSCAEAVRLALLAEHDRVELKKDLGAYVYEGERAGAVTIGVEGQKPYSVHITAAGAVTDSRKGEEPPEALRYCLRPAAFAALDAKSRRAALFRILGLNLSADAIKARLIAKGCVEAKVDAVAPILRTGFEAAAKHAQTQTSDARGAWKATTGENYGAVKAATWRAPCPAFSGNDAAELQRLDKSVVSAEAELADATKRLAIAEHEDGLRVRREAAATALRETAKSFAYHADLVARAEKEVADLKKSLAIAEQKAGTAPVEWPPRLMCPHCGGYVMDSEDGDAIVAWSDPPKVEHDPEAAARVPELRKAVALQETVRNRHAGNRDQADQAAKQLKAVEDATPAKAEDCVAVRQTADTLRTSIGTMKTRQSALRQVQTDMDAADERTKKARQYHQDVEDWAQIAAALSPDGIPAEILAEALGPINERLAQSAADTAWPAVEIGADMTITFGRRLYDFLSESEKWRADAMLAEGVAYLSGLRILLLDRFDVLDTQARGEALTWLNVLAENDEIETVIVLATLKQRPALPETMRAVWIADGAVVEEAEAAAA